MLWLLFAGLTAAAVVSVLWPLAKPPRLVGRGKTDIALYKAQLAEIERDEAQSLVAPEDAEGAKVEAARRLMAAAGAPESLAPATSPRRVWLASLAVLFLVPAVSISLYATIGHPELPDAPLAARLETAPSRMDLAVAVAKIEAHLVQHPDDGRGYEVLVPVYLQIGRTHDAVQAASAALRLLGPNAEREALYGETLVAAAQGVVTADAKQAFEAAAAADPSAPKPSFFLGLAAEQEGDAARAKEIWGKLAADAPQDAAWVQALRNRIASLDVRTGGPPQGPMAAKIEAMPADARMGAIRNMVDGLAARLAQNGQDVEGWLRLVRSYTVLHEPDKARAALIDAKRNLASDPNASARIDALARELGLEG
jgi:cytochrome c-type biogenesis protein CcmH